MTRRIVVLLGLMLAMAAPTFAQGGWGLKGGPVLAKITDEDDDLGADEARKGLSGGAFFNVPVTPMISIQPEVLYTQKGAAGSEDDIDFKLEANYVEIPILGVVHFQTPGSARPFVAAGPYFAFKRGDIKFTSDDIEIPDDENIDQDDVESKDIGFAIGGGVEYHRLGFEVRYSIGMTDLDKTDFGEVKNQVFSVMVSYAFGR
jgi:hypothetical protein